MRVAQVDLVLEQLEARGQDRGGFADGAIGLELEDDALDQAR